MEETRRGFLGLLGRIGGVVSMGSLVARVALEELLAPRRTYVEVA